MINTDLIEMQKVRPGGTATNAAAGSDPAAELLEGLRARRSPAFETVLDQHQSGVFRFFVLSHGDYELAQDQCAETFAELMRVIGRMRGEPGSLASFIYGIARNILRRSWRRKGPLIVSELPLEDMPDRGNSPFEIVSRRQLFERALAAILLLDEPARQVLLLRFIEELKLEEISVSLGLPLNSVKSLVRRGCERIRRMMDEEKTDVRPK